MRVDRLTRLDELGFEWDPLEAAWEQRFEELRAYKKLHGDCNVHAKWKKILGLGAWVSNQRTHYRTGRLDEGRIGRLRELGFEWRRSRWQ